MINFLEEEPNFRINDLGAESSIFSLDLSIEQLETFFPGNIDLFNNRKLISANLRRQLL